jgi:hypothetical protein
VRFVDRDVFLVRFANDCMKHQCRCLDEGRRVRLDACCQHGADLDLRERDAILRRAAEVGRTLHGGWRDPSRWFDESDAEIDADGTHWLRTALAGPDESSGCVFLQHDGRGCALHRTALEHEFDPAEIKPMVCRLYPLTLGEGILCLSDDFARYSCAEESGKTVYRLLRTTLARIFGLDLIAQLDRVERTARRRRLPVVAHP